MMGDNLSQRIAGELKDRIDGSKKGYRASDKLPNENDLSQELGVSRTTLREAIRILVNDGYLVVKRGRGTFVSSEMERFASSQKVAATVDSTKVTLRDLFEARLIIEPKAAALAAKRASDEEIAEILRLGEIVQKNIMKNPRGSSRIKSENDFHGAILKAAHNDFIESFIPLLTETIEKVFALDENLESIAEDAYKDHIVIMDCLKKRDEAAIESAVLIHLHHAAWNENLDIR
ncbi:MAG: GntR family transcriptional regulator [Eubacterium sp.]|nr:GntR family transcriptional regulator [Eubacterium sp.]